MRWPSVARRAEYPEWLEVIRLDRSDWRVSDLRAPVGDSARLLGYIEKVSARRFEIMWMGDRMKWGYVNSLAGALVGIALPEEFEGILESHREEPLPKGRALLHRIRRRATARKNSDLYLA